MGIKSNLTVENVKETSLAEIYFMQAEELRCNNQFKEAVDKYLHSILMNRNNPTSYLGLALSYKNLKNYKKAITNLEKAEKLEPFNASIQKELALCNIIDGNFCLGMKHLIAAIKLEPNNLDLQMQLALVHEMIEEEDMALMIYQKIIETNPEYLRAYIQKATLYMHLNDYLKSAKLFKTVIKKKEDYYRAHLALGICYEKLGNKMAAKRFYKKYIKISNNQLTNEEVKQRIFELEFNNKNEINNLRIL